MRLLAAALLLFCVAGAPLEIVPCLHAQEPGEQAVGPGRFAGAQRLAGEVTAVHGDTVDVKTADSATASIVTTTNTRVMRMGTMAKVADLKPGDGVLAVGQLDAPHHTLHAMLLVATDAAEAAKLRANLGKTYIAGRVTAVDLDAAHITVAREDGVSQTIAADENTSFRRPAAGQRGGSFSMGDGAAGTPGAPQGEPITLADVKAGDRLVGNGELKGGTFVARQLFVTLPREHHGRSSEGAAPAAPGAGRP